MRNVMKDLTSGLVTLALICSAFAAAIHYQPVADAAAAELRQA